MFGSTPLASKSFTGETRSLLTAKMKSSYMSANAGAAHAAKKKTASSRSAASGSWLRENMVTGIDIEQAEEVGRRCVGDDFSGDAAQPCDLLADVAYPRGLVALAAIGDRRQIRAVGRGARRPSIPPHS